MADGKAWKPQTEQEYQWDQRRFLGGGVDQWYLNQINKKWRRLGKLARNGSLK